MNKSKSLLSLTKKYCYVMVTNKFILNQPKFLCDEFGFEAFGGMALRWSYSNARCTIIYNGNIGSAFRE